jgi:hypothetical protein
MRPPSMRSIKLAAAFIFLTLVAACSKETGVRNDIGGGSGQPTVRNQEAATRPECDSRLWTHVYDPSRLEVIEQCRTVSGLIEELDQNEDGDGHMLLKLDPGQEDLLRKKNLKKKGGDLVLEVVCASAPTDKKTADACRGFSSTVRIPSVGDYVRVTGTLVLDSENGWLEIHPVTAIEPLRQGR